MGAFKVTINNVLLNANPQGIDNFSVVSEINREDFIIELSYATDLVFVEDGYAELKRLKDENYCEIIDCDIEILCGESFKTFVEGEIRLTNIEFNHYTCEARTKVIQRDFITRIKNNWDATTSVTGEVDINQVRILPVIGKRVSFLQPAGLGSYGDVTCYDLKEVFQYYIDYLTGSGITLKSDWYDNLPLTDKITICSTDAIITKAATAAAPVGDFETIYKDHAKAFNLLMGVVYEGDTPFIRIEEESFWYQEDDTLTTINELLEIKERFDESRLYSTVQFGSKDAIEGDGTTGESFPFISFWGFVSEVFTVSGSCSIENQLDLVIQNIVDSNEIEQIIVGLTTQGQDLFYIQTDTTLPTLSAFQPDDFITGKNFFNRIYQSNEVALRWNFQGDIRRDVDFGNNTYSASQISFTGVTLFNGLTLLTFDDDFTPPNFDDNANFDLSLERYTAPNNDLYLFRVQYLWRLIDLFPNNTGTFIQLQVRQFDSGGGLKNIFNGEKVLIRSPQFGINPSPLDVHRQIEFFDIFLEATDYVEFTLFAVVNLIGLDQVEFVSSGQKNGITVFRESSCVLTFAAGGLLKESDPDNYRVREFEFEDQLSVEEMIEVIRQPQKNFKFAGTGVEQKTGWVKSIEFDVKGTTQFKLLVNATD